MTTRTTHDVAIMPWSSFSLADHPKTLNETLTIESSPRIFVRGPAHTEMDYKAATVQVSGTKDLELRS